MWNVLDYVFFIVVMRVHKYDLSFIVIHGRDEVIKNNLSSIMVLNEHYSELVRRGCFFIDIITSVAKNSIANGVFPFVYLNIGLGSVV